MTELGTCPDCGSACALPAGLPPCACSTGTALAGAGSAACRLENPRQHNGVFVAGASRPGTPRSVGRSHPPGTRPDAARRAGTGSSGCLTSPAPSRATSCERAGPGRDGRIFQGRDLELGRDLAVKVIREEHRDHPEMVRRFVEEAQIGGQLQHPGITPVHDLGRFPDGRLFIAMKLVRGRTLAALLESRGGLDEDRMKFLSIFEQVCQAMAYAHSRGVIHRDLKPSNVMVGAFGEVQVMDWGLAKVLDEGGVASEDAAFRASDGTPSVQTLRYGSRARSQAGSGARYAILHGTRAGARELDARRRADVFALGSSSAKSPASPRSRAGPGRAHRRGAGRTFRTAGALMRAAPTRTW